MLAISEYQRSQAPPQLDVVAVVHNPIVVDDFPFRVDKEDYLLFIGRMNDDKGPHRAIAAARRAGMRLLLAGPVQPGQEEFFGAARFWLFHRGGLELQANHRFGSTVRRAAARARHSGADLPL